METHFDTQFVVRDYVKIIIGPKTAENYSTPSDFQKSTEIYKPIVHLLQKVAQKFDFGLGLVRDVFASVSGLPECLFADCKLQNDILMKIFCQDDIYFRMILYIRAAISAP